ncbi:MAG TPA: ATP-dependent DNA helicase RecG, partial [Verrucomicrobiae bacterium]|nr:ATP-dependent DNA helicase RecG [Verrucomicrobiae bacterium]
MNLKLETALRDVPGIGTARLAHLGKLRLHTVSDLLLHRPRRYENRRHPATIAQAVKGEHLLVRGRISAHGVNQFRRGAKSFYEFVLEDDTGRLHCRYWNQPYLQSQFAVGLELFVYSRITGLKPT